MGFFVLLGFFFLEICEFLLPDLCSLSLLIRQMIKFEKHNKIFHVIKNNGKKVSVSLRSLQGCGY